MLKDVKTCIKKVIPSKDAALEGLVWLGSVALLSKLTKKGPIETGIALGLKAAISNLRYQIWSELEAKQASPTK